MKLFFKALFIFFMPSVLLRCIKTSGFSLGKSSRIGFSYIKSKHIKIGDNCRIGSLNLIHVNEMLLGKGVFMGSLNIIRGRIRLLLGDKVEIYKQNKISAPLFNVADTTFFMEPMARIAVGHVFDLTNNITIGEGSCFAGLGSQVWTHSFYYSQTSRARVRVDKPVAIGKSCYIGSSVIVCPGATISDGITIGAGACVSKSLLKPGLYVSSALRYIETFDTDVIISKLGESEFYTEYPIYHEKTEP